MDCGRTSACCFNSLCDYRARCCPKILLVAAAVFVLAYTSLWCAPLVARVQGTLGSGFLLALAQYFVPALKRSTSFYHIELFLG